MGQLNNYTFSFTPGTKAESDQVNQNFKDIKNAHNATDTAAFYKDGTKAMTGNADMGSNKVTAMANGTAATDAVNKGQLDDIDVLTTAGDLLVFDTANARKAIGVNGQLLFVDTSEADKFKYKNQSEVSGALPLNYITGLNVENDAGDPEHDLLINAGVARDDSDTVNMILAASIVKKMASIFAEGTGLGGFETANPLPTSGTIHEWLIMKADGTVDSFANDNAVSGLSPTLPTDFIYKKHIMSRPTDSSANIIETIQEGEDVWLKEAIADVLSGVTATVETLVSLSTPAGVKTRAMLGVFTSIPVLSGTTYGLITSPQQDNSVPTSSNFNTFCSLAAGDTRDDGFSQINILTDESSQIRTRFINVNTNYSIITYGYKFYR